MWDVDKARARTRSCDGYVSCLHVSADSRTVTGDDGNKLIVWDVDKGMRTRTLVRRL